MTINFHELELELSKRIKNSTFSTDQLITFAKALELLQANRVVTVVNFSNLPSTTLVAAGSLYFVSADNRLYMADTYGSWRLLTQDFAATMWAWGAGTSGSLGDGTTVSKSSPASVIGNYADWCQVSAGTGFSTAVRSDGTLWAWGCASAGQLGDNTLTAKSSPISVVGGFTNWCQVSAGSSHVIGLRTDGTAWTWGCAGQGRLGDNTVTAKCSPVSVVGGLLWCRASAGQAHSVAIRNNGTLWAWGCNANGILGDGTTVSKSSPVSVIGGFTDWCQVSAGCTHTLAIRTGGTLWAWGSGNEGRLGDGTTVAKSSPVSVIGGFTDWCQVSAAAGHAVAVRTNGTAWAWGQGLCGPLGNNCNANQSSPISVIGGFTDWCQVTASSVISLGVRTNGTLWAWGYGGIGRLGDGTTIDKSSPVSVIGGYTDWSTVSAGDNGTVLSSRKRTF